MYKEKFYKITVGIILLLTIILLLDKVPSFTNKAISLISLILIPFSLSMFLYYMLRPSVRFFHKKLKNKTVAIFLTFFLVLLMLSIIIYFGGNIIYDQSEKIFMFFSENYEETVDKIVDQINKTDQKIALLQNIDMENSLLNFGKTALNFLKNYDYMTMFSSISNIITMLILTPFMLFYFLKDEEIIYENILSVISKKKRNSIKKILSEMDKSLETYIIAQLSVAIFLGLFMLIGYLIIGIPNAVALALIGMILSLIPIIGTIFGTIPAIFISLTLGFPMLLKVLLVLAVAQFLEGNIVRPLVQGKKLEIHPIIVIVVVIVSIYLFGALGALFAVPIYLIMKIAFKHRSIWKASEND